MGGSSSSQHSDWDIDEGDGDDYDKSYDIDTNRACPLSPAFIWSEAKTFWFIPMLLVFHLPSLGELRRLVLPVL